MPDPDHKSLDNDIQEIPSSAQTDDEALRAWQRAFNERVALPCDGFVIGEPVSVVEFCYGGNPRRGPDRAMSPGGRDDACRRGL